MSRTSPSIALALALLSARAIPACQYPPNPPPPAAVSIQCHLAASVECAEPGVPFTVSFTLTNMDVEPPLPPPYNDDQTFRIYAQATTSFSTGQRGTGGPEEDADGDFYPDTVDNCLGYRNFDQADPDADTVGTGCDNCPLVSNLTQADADSDGIGDDCDVLGGDADADAIPDDMDNCAVVVNPSQEDVDLDGRGNACDKCALLAGTSQEDADLDAFGDACDNCPTTPNGGGTDSDGDTIPDDGQRDTDGNGVGDACDTAGCWPGSFTYVPIDPAQQTVVLDDAWSPYADGPSVWEGDFTVTPDADAPGSHVTIYVYDVFNRVICSQEVCVLQCEQPEPTPSAWFDDPQDSGSAASWQDFVLHVDRGGYDPTAPLNVQVIRENFSDPSDILPMLPMELVTTGVTVTDETATIPCSCMLKGACFIGVANSFHVVLTDERSGTVVFDSRDLHRQGIGRATVSSIPLAMSEVVAVEDDGGNGRLMECEHGVVHVRLIARDPYVLASLQDVTLDTTFPSGFTVQGYDLVFPDNMMDGYTPTPAELAATGVVVESPGAIHVDTTDIQPRYPGGPPYVQAIRFQDMFTVDLRLETPSDGLRTGDVTLSGLTVVATPVDGTTPLSPQSFTSGPLTIEVDPMAPLPEVSGVGDAQPLVFRDVDTLAWDGAAADAFNVYRGRILGLQAGERASCLAANVGVGQVDDPQRPAPELGWFYLVAARTCAGEGPLGAGSDGLPRLADAPCP